VELGLSLLEPGLLALSLLVLEEVVEQALKPHQEQHAVEAAVVVAAEYGYQILMQLRCQHQ
jgi:hypothetical protein